MLAIAAVLAAQIAFNGSISPLTTTVSERPFPTGRSRNGLSTGTVGVVGQ